MSPLAQTLRAVYANLQNDEESKNDRIREEDIGQR